MPGQMFGEISNPTIMLGSQKWYTVPVSIATHVGVIALFVIIPLMASDILPMAPSMMAFVAAPPPPPPPPAPPPPPEAAAPEPVPDMNLAPIEAPAQIVPETGFDLRDAGGIEAVVAGGVVGGIVGGLDSLMPPPPPPPPAPVRVGGNIKAPQRIKNVNPVYPSVALAAQITGIVILEAIIGLDGKVSDVKVLRGTALLDAAAIDAVRQWEYTPTLLNGVPIRVVMTVTVNFTLQ